MNSNDFPFKALPGGHYFRDYLALQDNLDGEVAAGPADGDFTLRLPARVDFIFAVYCREGHIRLEANLYRFDIAPGQLVIGIPGTIVSEMEVSPDCRMFSFCLNKRNALDREIPGIIGKFIGDISLRPILISLPEPFGEKYVELYRQLKCWISADELSLKDDAVYGTIQTMMSLTGSFLYKAGPANAGGQLHGRFIALVSQHYRTERGVSFYADKLCVSAKYLGRAIKEVTGRTPTEIIRDYVILDAKALLRSGRYTVGQIADELHFASASFFCKYFRQAVGVSPAAYGK